MRVFEILKEAVEFDVKVPTTNRGTDVADLQKALVALGYPLPKHGVDGIKGPETAAAVRKFQQANQLAADGIAGVDTVAAINAALAANPGVATKLTKSTQADVKAKRAVPTAGPEVGAVEGNTEDARASAEAYLGRKMSDNEWNYLLRATSSEASPNTNEQAHVMAVILNRARSGRWGDVVGTLTAKNQFQAVTGTKQEPGPSRHFTAGPSKQQLASIIKGATDVLPTVNKSLMNFTAASSAAYGPGTNIGYRDKLIAQGGKQIGGTIFA